MVVIRVGLRCSVSQLNLICRRSRLFLTELLAFNVEEERITWRDSALVNFRVNICCMNGGSLCPFENATKNHFVSVLLTLIAGYARTDTDWSVNTGSTCAVSASGSTRKTSASSRYVYWAHKYFTFCRVCLYLLLELFDLTIARHRLPVNS